MPHFQVRFRYFFSLATAITPKYFKTFSVKQERNNRIKLAPQSKLDNIANISSQSMQDGEISSTECGKVLQEVEKCLKFRADLRNQAKTLETKLKPM